MSWTLRRIYFIATISLLAQNKDEIMELVLIPARRQPVNLISLFENNADATIRLL